MPRAVRFKPTNGIVGPTALAFSLAADSDRALAQDLVNAYVRGTSDADRAPFKPYQIF